MTEDREIAAITKCLHALSGLDLGQQKRVLNYLSDRNDGEQKVADSWIEREGQ